MFLCRRVRFKSHEIFIRFTYFPTFGFHRQQDRRKHPDKYRQHFLKPNVNPLSQFRHVQVVNLAVSVIDMCRLSCGVYWKEKKFEECENCETNSSQFSLLRKSLGCLGFFPSTTITLANFFFVMLSLFYVPQTLSCYFCKHSELNYFH